MLLLRVYEPIDQIKLPSVSEIITSKFNCHENVLGVRNDKSFDLILNRK